MSVARNQRMFVTEESFTCATLTGVWMAAHLATETAGLAHVITTGQNTVHMMMRESR